MISVLPISYILFCNSTQQALVSFKSLYAWMDGRTDGQIDAWASIFEINLTIEVHFFVLKLIVTFPFVFRVSLLLLLLLPLSLFVPFSTAFM